MASMYGLYRCEVNFYRHVAGAISLRTPRCYYGDVDDAGTTFLLLLEDLGQTGVMGDQVVGCRLEQARLAVRELARFHATWLENPKLNAMEWLPLGIDLGRMSLERAYPAGWEICVRDYGDKLPRRLVDAIPTLNERLLAMLPQFEDAPLTIMHGDYRLDNMFFGGRESGYELAVIDWQIANRGWGLYDVAYFLTSNLEPDARRTHEEELLREYHAIVTKESGVEYDWQRCREDYALSTAVYFANMVGNIASLDPADERGLALFDLILTRIATAVEDLDALSALP
jgi:aminoglycoside/choline kinase family phosphotransferase